MQESLRSLLRRKRSILKGGCFVKGFEHKINLENGTRPVVMLICRGSPAEKQVEEYMDRKLLNRGVLEKENSNW